MGATLVEPRLILAGDDYARIKWLLSRASKKAGNTVLIEPRAGQIVVSSNSKYEGVRVFVLVEGFVEEGSEVEVSVQVASAALASGSLSGQFAIDMNGVETTSWRRSLKLPAVLPRLAQMTDWRSLARLGGAFTGLAEEREVMRSVKFIAGRAFATDGRRAMSIDGVGRWINGYVHAAIFKMEAKLPVMWLGFNDDVALAFRDAERRTGYLWASCSGANFPCIEKVLEGARDREFKVKVKTAEIVALAKSLKSWSKLPQVAIGEVAGRIRVIDGERTKGRTPQPSVDLEFSFDTVLPEPLGLNITYLAQVCEASGQDEIYLYTDDPGKRTSVYFSGSSDGADWEHVLMPVKLRGDEN